MDMCLDPREGLNKESKMKGCSGAHPKLLLEHVLIVASPCSEGLGRSSPGNLSNIRRACASRICIAPDRHQAPWEPTACVCVCVCKDCSPCHGRLSRKACRKNITKRYRCRLLPAARSVSSKSFQKHGWQHATRLCDTERHARAPYEAPPSGTQHRPARRGEDRQGYTAEERERQGGGGGAGEEKEQDKRKRAAGGTKTREQRTERRETETTKKATENALPTAFAKKWPKLDGRCMGMARSGINPDLPGLNPMRF